jgi:prepilin-type processing-associated H-X9-DG protein
MPPWGFDFNPAPAGNVLGPQTEGHSAFSSILPQIEQGNIFNTGVNLQWSVIDPRNWPPPYGTAIGGQTKIKIFLCPSAPHVTIDYQPYFTSQGIPNQGPFLLGGTDYGIIRGLTQAFTSQCAPASPFDQGSMGVGALGVKGVMTNGALTQGNLKITDMVDGTSNTYMIGEDAGRHQVWAAGIPVQPYVPGQAGWTLNAAWADYNTYIRVQPTAGNGTVGAGCCVINCNNVNQFYAFHTGGANMLRGDGSVAFVNASTAPGVLAAMVTRQGGEVFNAN